MRYQIHTTKEYREWFSKESLKSQVQIEKRLSNIELNGHFGILKNLGSFIWELKWENGRRIYYTYVEELDILLLLGGNKNGQDYDISQAKKILKKYTEDGT